MSMEDVDQHDVAFGFGENELQCRSWRTAGPSTRTKVLGRDDTLVISGGKLNQCVLRVVISGGKLNRTILSDSSLSQSTLRVGIVETQCVVQLHRCGDLRRGGAAGLFRGFAGD